jgi:3D (Asp-Asp-Asp) domain-containing protein
MKAKLLKKIRRQYSIVYFEKGSQVYGLGAYDEDLYHVIRFIGDIGLFFDTKQKALDWVLKDVKIC